MDSTRNQDKTHDTQKLSASMEQENSGIKPQKSQDHQRNEDTAEKQCKPSEQSQILGAQKCGNGERDENFEIFHEELVDEEPMTTNESMEQREMEEENGGAVGPRERLKRHRTEVAGQVWIPEMWGQEDFLKDWMDCAAFDACLVPQGIMSARASLVEEGRRANSGSFRVENRC